MMDLTYFLAPDLIEKILRSKSTKFPPFDFTNPATATGRIMFGLVRNGPKLFRCSQELYELALEIDLRIDGDDYVQPFPVTIVQLHTGTTALTYCEDGVVAAMLFTQPRDATTYTFTGPLDQPAYDPLGVATDKLREEHQVILTINTLLCYFGTVFAGWVDPLQQRRSERSGRFKERNIELIAMKQSIDAIGQLRHATKIYDETDRTVRPHFRRAHMRRCGKNKVLRLIPAVFVNERYFAGRLSDSEVVIECQS